MPSNLTFRQVSLIPSPQKPKSYMGKGVFCFLNMRSDLGWPIDWEAATLPLLWRYQLHYFDYIHQPGLSYDEGINLIRHWIREHPPRRGAVGWESYPISRRLVNWVKFLGPSASPPEDVQKSLYLHGVNLASQIEYHILGNHLFSNGKALWWIGIIEDNEKWQQRGKKIVFSQIREQFLADGGHFELSPMYHSFVLEDLLDLINLCKTTPQTVNEKELSGLRCVAEKALGWLKGLIDDQGQFPLLNDSSCGVAPSYSELECYAQMLEISPNESVPQTSFGSWSGKNYSGYWVLRNGSLRLIYDTAPLGPDYLLAHSHCDILAVTLDFAGNNILTDTGVFQYEEGERRHYSRCTSAHNTVVIDGRDQAELWKSFRVGRRGRPINFIHDGNILRCAHTGFGIWESGLIHERALSLLENGFTITDVLKGPRQHNYEAFFHFDPDVRIENIDHGKLLINNYLILEIWNTPFRMTTNEYYPEFGKIKKRPCLILYGTFNQQIQFGLGFSIKLK